MQNNAIINIISYYYVFNNLVIKNGFMNCVLST